MKNSRHYQRLTTITLEQGLALVRLGVSEVTILNERVAVNSLRLRTFLFKGVHCCERECHLRGEFWAIERSGPYSPHALKKYPEAGRFHINLYAMDNGNEVLMTHDHIIARSLGGQDHLRNCQTMCTWHNTSKSRLESRVYNLLRALNGCSHVDCFQCPRSCAVKSMVSEQIPRIFGRPSVSAL